MYTNVVSTKFANIDSPLMACCTVCTHCTVRYLWQNNGTQNSIKFLFWAEKNVTKENVFISKDKITMFMFSCWIWSKNSGSGRGRLGSGSTLCFCQHPNHSRIWYIAAPPPVPPQLIIWQWNLFLKHYNLQLGLKFYNVANQTCFSRWCCFSSAQLCVV